MTTVSVDARPRSTAAHGLPRLSAGTVGPALLVAAGYVDPGNWGTDVAAGARFGFQLVWVLAAATGAALFLQHLSARLGYVTGRDLLSLLRERLPRPARMVVLPPLLTALAVTEIVEVLGVVIGVQMLTGWSGPAALLTAAVLVLALLVAPGQLARRITYGCLLLVGAVYVSVLLLHGSGGAARGLRPAALPPGGLPVAVGLIGSIVMPHNILLHSALARDERHSEYGTSALPPAAVAWWQRRSLLATAAALAVALVVNVAIMSVAHDSGAHIGFASMVHQPHPSFGPVTNALFAISLIGAGLASSMTGALISADVIGQLFSWLPSNEPVRRLVCLLPAAAVIASGQSEIGVLVWSQVVLTLALPLVLVPLIWFSSQSRLTGRYRLGGTTRTAAWAVTGSLCAVAVASLFTN